MPAVVDWLETRRDVDAARIGLWGVSLGGYYAPRAAAFEKRIKACIALSGPYELGRVWDGLPDLTRDAFRVRSHCADEADAEAHRRDPDAQGRRAPHRLPDLHRRPAGSTAWCQQDAERLARDAKGRPAPDVEDGSHVANNRAYRYRTQSADWMAERLGYVTLLAAALCATGGMTWLHGFAARLRCSTGRGNCGGGASFVLSPRTKPGQQGLPS